MVEGFLDITQIVIKDIEVFPTPNPVFMGEGEKAGFNIKVKNTGATDDFRVEIFGNGELLKYDEFSCPAGVEDWIYPEPGLVLTMGDTDVIITVKTFHLVEPWIYTGVSYDISAAVPWVNGPWDFFWDGANWFVSDWDGNRIYKFDSNWIYTGISYDVSAQGPFIHGIFWDGTNWWAVGGFLNKRVYKYDSNWVYTGTSYDVSQSPDPAQIFWDGANWWMMGWGDPNVKIYKYDSNWNYLGVSLNIDDLSAPEGVSSANDIFYDGTNWWVTWRVGFTDIIYKYDSNWIYTGVSYDITAQETGGPHGIFWDGTNWWVISTKKKVWKYTG